MVMVLSDVMEMIRNFCETLQTLCLPFLLYLLVLKIIFPFYMYWGVAFDDDIHKVY